LWWRALFCLAPVLAALVAVPALATPGDVHYVEARGAELRAAPEPGAPVVARLAGGHKLIEFERRGAWLRVGVFGAIGQVAWVRADRITRRPVEPSGVRLPEVIRGPGAALPTAPAPPPEPEGPARFRLSVSGSPALEFTGECDLVETGDRSRRQSFAGLVPARFYFAASAISCLVRKRDFRGRLRVALRRDRELIARAETAAAFNHVRVRSAGPWGAAAGWRGHVRLRQFEIAPEARGRIVPPLSGATPPPLTGPIVPPLSGTPPPLTGGTP
jgi:hypothetical protein